MARNSHISGRLARVVRNATTSGIPILHGVDPSNSFIGNGMEIGVIDYKQRSDVETEPQTRLHSAGWTRLTRCRFGVFGEECEDIGHSDTDDGTVHGAGNFL